MNNIHTNDPKEDNTDSLHQISKWIRGRKSTYARDFKKQKIAKTTIEEIVTNALWAPTHKMTQPWRFEILEGAHHKDLGTFLATFKSANLPLNQFPESKYQETLNYPLNATLLAIIFQRSKRIQIPEWEEIAAISCAVQNIWISCSAMGIGGYWSSGRAVISYCEENLDLAPNEKSLGIFYMGYAKEELEENNRNRKSIQKKLSWNTK